MTIPGSASPLLLRTAAAGGYAIQRSIRLNAPDSAYLSRTPASAGDRKTWTWAGWVKRSGSDSFQSVFYAGTNESNRTGLSFTDTNAVSFFHKSGGSVVINVSTVPVFRDFSAWYHFVVAFDSANATASQRLRIYTNGVGYSFASNPVGQNDEFFINTTNAHFIGAPPQLSEFYPGYLADIHFIDGQALDPTSFGEFDDNGIWQPIEYTGSYGTNGFRLDFSDNSAATATTLGKDRAGSNNWTPNNLSVTAGAGNDSLVDVPTNGAQTDTGAGGEVRGNYSTLNPLDNGGITLTNGNLDWARPSAGTRVCYSTIGVSSGKWYFESSIVGATGGVNWECGVATTSASNAARPGTTATGWQALTSGSTTIIKQNNNTTTTIFTGTIASGDIFSVALDMDNGRIWFGRNGTWLEGNPAAGTGASFTNLSGTVEAFAGGDGSVSGSINFGQRPFAYTAPSGFKALNTANLPAPLVTKPSDLFDVKLYTGNGSTQTISGLGFSPDLVWIKNRAAADNHKLTDIVRGATEEIESNTTDAEATNADGLTQFNADGFDLGDDDEYNTSAEAYVAWTWDAGSSTVTNTVGSISSQVRANASAGFSVVTYSGNSSTSGSVGHGLGVSPSMVIIKARNASKDWKVAHISLAAQDMVSLNQVFAANIASWDGVTSTVFKPARVGDTYNNTSGENYVAYCFAPVAGYSSFGSYTGGGSEYPFVYCGFRPRWIMIKNASTGGTFYDWHMVDTARNPYNFGALNSDSQYTLFANTSGQEQQWFSIDILSNGFRVIDQSVTVNNSGSTFIYAAFAEHPFQYARAR